MGIPTWSAEITITYSQTFPKTSIGVQKFTLSGPSFHFTFLREMPNEYSFFRGDNCDRKRYFYFMALLFEEEAGGHRSEVLVVVD